MKDIIEQLFSIIEKNPSTCIEINPFLGLIVVKDASITIYDYYKKNEIAMDDNYTDIELEKPTIYGIINGKKKELVLENGKLIKK